MPKGRPAYHLRFEKRLRGSNRLEPIKNPLSSDTYHFQNLKKGVGRAPAWVRARVCARKAAGFGLKQFDLVRVLAGELLELALCQFHADYLLWPAVYGRPAQPQRLQLNLCPSAFWRAVLHQKFVRQFHGAMMRQRFR